MNANELALEALKPFGNQSAAAAWAGSAGVVSEVKK